MVKACDFASLLLKTLVVEFKEGSVWVSWFQANLPDIWSGFGVGDL